MPFGSMIVHIAKSKTKDDPIGIHNCSYCKNNYKDKREMKGLFIFPNKGFWTMPPWMLQHLCNVFFGFQIGIMNWVGQWSIWGHCHFHVVPLFQDTPSMKMVCILAGVLNPTIPEGEQLNPSWVVVQNMQENTDLASYSQPPYVLHSCISHCWSPTPQ